ncbi:MAG: hypothetical protein EBU93_06895, partial [Chlamydiae bacterium]|nr:hypothetical protein [Chlamydiota bacterium]
SNIFQGFRIDYLDGIYLSTGPPTKESQKPITEGFYKSNKKNGKWKHTVISYHLHVRYSVYNDGTLVKEKKFINGKLISNFHWKDGRFHGCQYYANNGKERFEYYHNGELHGRIIEKKENSNVILLDCTYINGKEDGKLIERWWNKKVKLKNHWVNGIKHGCEVEFHETGKIFKRGMFKNGLPIGKHKLWWPNGKVCSITTYDETGNVISNIEFDQKGQKKLLIT